MLASLTPSSLKQYNVHLKRWWLFCEENSWDPMEITVDRILRFLILLHEQQLSYSSINAARSAVSLISSPDGGIGKDPTVSRFMRGIFKKNPQIPKYNCTWDVLPVLNFLKSLYPLENLTLMQLTQKLVTLVALATAHRVQTLAAIKIKDINKRKDGIEVPISSCIKTTRPGSKQPVLWLPYFRDYPSLCVASTMDHYLRTTESIRGNSDSLFLSYQKPHQSVCSQTLSHWIKSVMKLAGIDSKYTAHSTRHAATSKARAKGVDVETIRKTAGWSSESSVFQKFYNQPIINNTENVFSQSVFSDM